MQNVSPSLGKKSPSAKVINYQISVSHTAALQLKHSLVKKLIHPVLESEDCEICNCFISKFGCNSQSNKRFLPGGLCEVQCLGGEDEGCCNEVPAQKLKDLCWDCLGTTGRRFKPE